MKSYYYTNNIGRKKRLDVFWDNGEDKIFSVIYDMTTGEQCSQGHNTKEEIVKFLHHYNVNI